MAEKKSGEPLVAEVLRTHDKFKNGKTKTCVLGDGFFYRKNPVFRHFRDRLLELGYALSAEGASRYNGWPLMALDQSIRSKKLIYIDNVYFLRELEKTRPRYFGIHDVLDFGPKKVPILHESAHCLADYYSKKFVPRSKLKDNNRQEIMKILISESFALSVEALSTLFLKNDPIEIFFHRLSIHVYKKNFKNDPVSLAHRKFGLESAFRIILACYLYTNFLFRELGDLEVENILTWAQLPNNSKAKSLVKRIFEKACEVGREFQVMINSRYLKMHGHDGSILKILNFDPIDYCSQSQKISSFVDALTEEVGLIEIPRDKA